MYKKINKEFEYSFHIEKDGIYAVSIEASCKPGKLLGLFGGEDLRVEIDGIQFQEIPAKNKPQHYDIPPSWNGTKLKGLSKTVVFILPLAKGAHTVKFIPKQGATINKEPEIKAFDAQKSVIENIQAQDGNRRPWMTIALVGLPLKTVDIAVSCEKRARDSDDAKIIIDNKTQQNEQKGWWGKNWHWRGSQLQGSAKEAGFYPDLPKGIHYVELWADRTPTLKSLKMNVGTSDAESEEKIDEKVVIRPYKYRGVSGNEDYNRYDTEILAAVDYWNGQFLKDTDPPQEPLDPNLVKAMIFVESRVGYYQGGEVDVMQVGNPGDDALRTLNHKLIESWIHNGEEIELNYNSKANAETVSQSIHWGVRWLYHKAQGIRDDGSRYWISWREAMEGYGPQEKEHNDAIWSIYKKGVDTRKNKQIRLWSFALIAFLLFILLLNYGIFESQDTQDKGRVSGVAHQRVNRIEINKYIDQRITEALSQYQSQPESDGWELFRPLRTLCENDSCARTLAVDYLRAEYMDELISHAASPRELLSIMDDMDVLEPHTWEYQDIDNDGEKELVFVDLDMLNHEFLDVVVVDVVGGKMANLSKRFDDYHYFSSPDSALEPLRPLRLLDVTGDALPEILVFGSWGRMGARLRILQYAAGAIKDREFVDDFTYPVYTFYDRDHDGVLEISVSGEDPCNFGTFEYSCGNMYKDAIIKYNKTTDSFVYNRI